MDTVKCHIVEISSYLKTNKMSHFLRKTGNFLPSTKKRKEAFHPKFDGRLATPFFFVGRGVRVGVLLPLVALKTSTVILVLFRVNAGTYGGTGFYDWSRGPRTSAWCIHIRQKSSHGGLKLGPSDFSHEILAPSNCACLSCALFEQLVLRPNEKSTCQQQLDQKLHHSVPATSGSLVPSCRHYMGLVGSRDHLSTFVWTWTNPNKKVPSCAF